MPCSHRRTCFKMYYSAKPQPEREGGRLMGAMQVQSQIADVIEPTAEKLIPIAQELRDVYRQIELLEVPPPSLSLFPSVPISFLYPPFSTLYPPYPPFSTSPLPPACKLDADVATNFRD